MRKEIQALEDNETWMRRLASEKKAIRSKWVYKIKYNSDGSIERCKLRRVGNYIKWMYIMPSCTYTLDIISEVGLLGAKPIGTPLEQNHKLALAANSDLSDPGQYRRLVGRILLHSDCDLKLYAYYDSNWASCPLTRQSLTGYFILLGNSPISWKSKKQHTVSRSSAEAEYRSMATTTCELKWLKGLLSTLGVMHSDPMHLYYDSQAALHITANPIQNGVIHTKYVHTSMQLANIFTKALGKRQFDFLLRKLGVRNPHAPT
ncbi:hypothetical protein AAG906_011152 [Vitis piasezkii]